MQPEKPPICLVNEGDYPVDIKYSKNQLMIIDISS